MTTTERLADAQQAIWLWKTPQMLAIAVAVVKFFAEHDGPHFTDEVPLDFVDADDKNLIGNIWLPLRKRGFLDMTGKYRRSTKPASKCRVVWQYRLINYGLAREFLRRQNHPLKETQPNLL